MANNSEIELAYTKAIAFTNSHYENFPVLSFLVPQKLHKHIAIVYQFARQADDIADEGDNTSEKRIELLNEYELSFKKSLDGKVINPFWIALANTIQTQELDANNFTNLLIAFRQDVTQTRYSTHDELLNYCKHSANPVGRIILELHNIKNDKANIYSDKICTALQLTNFLQDVAIDFDKGRIYLPIEKMNEFSVDENTFHLRKISSNFKELLKAEVDQISNYFDEGKKLLPLLPFRLKQQIKWTINGGKGILKKIENLEYDVLNSRAKFSKTDLMNLLFNIQIK
ncbi:MAG: squalene synthase HpnC [Melioribacteraceae bacterium]|nr:squalene synthase HpnC [Melioribacteraceae bacterium]